MSLSRDRKRFKYRQSYLGFDSILIILLNLLNSSRELCLENKFSQNKSKSTCPSEFGCDVVEVNKKHEQPQTLMAQALSSQYYPPLFPRVGFIDPFSDPIDSRTNNNDDNVVSLDTILPDDLLERILSCLPIASIFRASSVCKRWHEIVTSKRFLWNFTSNALPQKPWYYMFMGTDEPYGLAYDPSLRKWYTIELPYFVSPNWFIASSFGLVCFMNNDARDELYVHNPITRTTKTLADPPGVKFPDYTALAMSTDRAGGGSHDYMVSVVKSKQVPEDFFRWDLSVHVYDSRSSRWATPLTEVLHGWRAGDESVICNGFLYFLLYSTGGGAPESRHGLIRFSLTMTARTGPSSSAHGPEGLLMGSFIPAPCSLTCGRLMNLKEKLVMVGGIGKQDRSDIIKGIGIWVLCGTQWNEVARMPHKYFQGFGEFDDVFASSGTDDFIYIQSYGAPVLLLFDMSTKQWKWSQKCPVTKRFPLQLFTGFCFEPRLEVSP